MSKYHFEPVEECFVALKFILRTSVFDRLRLTILCHPELVEGCFGGYNSFLMRPIFCKFKLTGAHFFSIELIIKFIIMSLGHSYVVYIVECNDGQYYTGMTNNLDKRLYEHNTGLNPTSFTYSRRPVVLKYFQYFSDVNQAIAWEKQLKGWSRKKKEALFESNWELIKKLAKSKSSTSSD